MHHPSRENSESEQSEADGSETDGNEDSGSDQAEGNDENDQPPPIPSWYALFQELLISRSLDPELVDPLVDWIDDNNETTGAFGAEDQYYLSLDPAYRTANQQLITLSDLLHIKGFSKEVVTSLSPYISTIPLSVGAGNSNPANFAKINVNTAPAEVLVILAAQPGASAGSVHSVTGIQGTKPL